MQREQSKAGQWLSWQNRRASKWSLCPCSSRGNSPQDAGKQKQPGQYQELSVSFCLNYLINPGNLLNHFRHFYLDCSDVPGDTRRSNMCRQNLCSQVLPAGFKKVPNLSTLHVTFYQLWCYKFTYFLGRSHIFWSLRSTMQFKLSWLHILSQIHLVIREGCVPWQEKCQNAQKCIKQGFFPGGYRESVVLFHWRNHTMSLSGVVALGEKSSQAYERFWKEQLKKKVSFLKMLLTCNALFASFISSIFSFDLKNKIMLFQTSTWSVML